MTDGLLIETLDVSRCLPNGGRPGDTLTLTAQVRDRGTGVVGTQEATNF